MVEDLKRLLDVVRNGLTLVLLIFVEEALELFLFQGRR